ncbi:hypothetical protein F4810DRAFT_720220, partial [Camillea tinctor]
NITRAKGPGLIFLFQLSSHTHFLSYSTLSFSLPHTHTHTYTHTHIHIHIHLLLTFPFFLFSLFFFRPPKESPKKDFVSHHTHHLRFQSIIMGAATMDCTLMGYEPYSPTFSRRGKRKVDDASFDDIATSRPAKRLCSYRLSSTPPRSSTRRRRYRSEPLPGQSHGPIIPPSPLEPLPSLPLVVEAQTPAQEQTQEQIQEQIYDHHTVLQSIEQQSDDESHDELRSSSPLTQLDSSGLITSPELSRLEPQYTGKDTAQHQITTEDQMNHARDEIRKNISFLKSLTSDSVLDVDTAIMLLDDIIEVTQHHELIDSHQEMVAMKDALSPESSASRGTSPILPLDIDANTTSPSLTKERITTYVDASTLTDQDDVSPNTQPQSPAYINQENQTEATQNSASSDLELWKREVEGTRRPKPLVDPRGYGIITVKTSLRQQPSTTKKPTSTFPRFSSSYLTGGGEVNVRDIHFPVPDRLPSLSRVGPRRSSSRQQPYTSFTKDKHPIDSNAIDLMDDDDDVQDIARWTRDSWGVGGAGFDYTDYESGYYYRSSPENSPEKSEEEEEEEDYYQRNEPRDPPSFYNIRDEYGPILLRYQDRQGSRGLIPSPRNGLRLNFAGYLRDIKFEHPDDLPCEIKDILWHSWRFRTLDDDAVKQREWTRSQNKTCLMKGFPLVEDITFLVNMNYTAPSGDCYWRAISLSLYGTADHWDLVKAEHLEHVYAVLTSRKHPRYELYSKLLNNKFFRTNSGLGGAPFMANLWQVLHMPHAWTPGVMQQITADLYNIHLVTFSYDSSQQKLGKESCREVSVRGPYNARHVFILYKDNNHFQPMTPNEYFEWEFRYPRLTVENTARFSNAPKAGSRRVKSSREHPWRWEHTNEVLPPVPRVHGCDMGKLMRLMDDDKGQRKK